MDSSLKARLEKIHNQVRVLSLSEEKYLTLDAAKEHTLAVLMRAAPEENSSDASRKAFAYASEDWLKFKTSLALAEADFHRQKHMLDLMNHAFTAEYLGAKIEYDLVKKG